MSNKHTPGPWTIERDGSRGLIQTARGNTIAEVWDVDQPFGQADTALIAAAPDLAEALRRLLVQAESARIEGPYSMALVEALGLARAALAKAQVQP